MGDAMKFIDAQAPAINPKTRAAPTMSPPDSIKTSFGRIGKMIPNESESRKAFARTKPSAARRVGWLALKLQSL